GLARTVTVFHAGKGATPPTSGTTNDTTLRSGITTGESKETFTGTLLASELTGLVDGDELRWVVRVELSNPETPCTQPCLDPVQTTGQAYYRATVDRSTPGIFMNPISGAFIGNTTANEWYVYSPPSLNPPLPFAVTVFDHQAGSPIVAAKTQILRNGENVTTVFDSTSTTPTAITYTYDPTQDSQGSFTFNANKHTKIDMVAEDRVGHRFDSAEAGSPAIRVVIDNITPEVTNTSSQLKLLPGQTGLASVGELLRIAINGTDKGADLNTPKQLMRVCARLIPAADDPKNLSANQRQAEADKCATAPFASASTAANLTTGQYLRIPYVKVGKNEFHMSESFSVPNDWNVNGLATAQLVVMDPVGRFVMGKTLGVYCVNGAASCPDNQKKNSNITVDLLAPVIEQKEPLSGSDTSDFVAANQVRFRIRVTDPGDTDAWNGGDPADTDLLGVDEDSVKVRYRVDGGNQVSLTLRPISEENHFASNPLTLAEEDTLTYFYEARDFSGNPVRLPQNGTFEVQVDRKGPIIEEAKDHEFLNGDTHTFRFNVTDDGVGLDASRVNLFWRTPGTQYKSVTMTSQGGDVFVASVPGQEDGTTLEWYAEARDTFGNLATLPATNPTGAPKTTLIDLTPPNTTITAPDQVTSAKFNITWSAVDNRGAGDGSGADTYHIEFRVGEGGRWFTLVRHTRETSFEVCADAQKTYFFRGSATDRAGNVEAFPDTPQTQTFVDASEACADPPSVTLIAPKSGDTVSGDFTVRWTASSQVAPEGLTVNLEVAPTGGEYQTLASGDAVSDGSHVWETASMDANDPCFEAGTYDLRVRAVDPNDKIGTDEATGIKLENGITDCDDRDGDGLLDSWERGNFCTAGQPCDLTGISPDADADQDGHTNEQEFSSGSDPNDAQSVPGSRAPNGGGGDDETGWNNLYLLVVLAFLATLVVFVVGVTRRW
ncbi:MAG: hypothetical protein KY455_08095, partial [Euryarchaeota archaeon]|nr:hypothetical protein [Euryarchaeota archaeon]